MISKYLSDLGIKKEDLPWNWETVHPLQEKELAKQRKEHGFDVRDTWDLTYTLALLIYPRLKMYDEANCINTSFHKFEFEGKEYTQQECIDMVLEGLGLYLKKNGQEINNEEFKKIEDSMKLLGLIWWKLWW